jgi:diaminopimelate epimerase
MRLDFTKMHGIGNDFIVFEARTPEQIPDADQLRALADRRTGIGFDQALVVTPPRDAASLAYYRNFNADGGEIEQCGNGVRCIAEWLRLQQRTGTASTITLGTLGGTVHAKLLRPGFIAVDMGVPDFTPASLPFTAAAEAALYTLEVAGQRVEFAAVSMGNPHAVLTVPDVARAQVETLGPAFEHHPAFPRRVNVGFMQLVSPAEIRLRVFERGVGETLACGTGACAAVAVGRKAGRLEAAVTVHLPGGDLAIEWAGPGAPLWMTGPAEVAFRGEVEVV